MTLRRPVFLLLALSLALFAQRKDPAVQVGPTQPAVVRAMPPSRSIVLTRPHTIALGGLSVAERAQLGAVGSMRRVGVHRSLPDGSMAGGTWTNLAGGRSIWRVAIQSDNASGMRVQFSNFSAGTGRVWVDSGTAVDGPYTDRGPYGNGEFWSATVSGANITIEYEAPAGADQTVPFHVHRISHQAFQANPFPFAAIPFATTADNAAYCELDVNCYPQWQPARDSVAQIQFEETQGVEQGTFLCSGSAVATRDNSFKPYLLTAGHCIHDEDAARSLETFWKYQSQGCNLGPPPDRGSLNSQNGGNLIAWNTIENGDYSLVLLPNIPAGVVFAGWDTGDPPVGTPLTGIHHPEGSYKRISFGNTVTSQDVLVGTDDAPAGLYHDVVWSTGITEPGSSGSPLFSSPGVIVGTLTYGPDEPGYQLCQGNDVSGYGKFSNAYVYLQAYLEDFPYSEVTPAPTNLTFTGLNHAITGTTTQKISLTTQAASPVTWSARGDSPWLVLSQNSGTVSAGTAASFTVSVNPMYFIATDTYTSTITILSGAAPPLFVNVTVNNVIQTSNVVATASPNPVPSNAGSWQLTINLQETAGAATTLTHMKIDGVDYTASIAQFFGSTNLPANGTLSATLHTSGLVTPVTKYFEFYGTDVASGNTWYRLLPVTFMD